MESRRVTRHLRIAVTALCLTACVLLVALWVRSYPWHEYARITIVRDHRDLGFLFGSGGGWFVIDVFDYGPPGRVSERTFMGQRLLQLPYWQLVSAIIVLAVAPWIPKRFSLRVFLIAITLVAIALGIIVNYWPYYFPRGIAFSWSYLLLCFGQAPRVRWTVMLKCLRIAVTALSLTACVLLVALWVRSYWRYDWLGGLSVTPRNNEFLLANGCLIESASGVLVVIYAGNLREWLSSPGQMIGSSPAMSSLRVTGNEGESAWDGFRAKIYPNGIFRGSVPHWFFAFVLGAAGAFPWIRRFSLRTLLIATTLVALVLGVVIT